MGTFAYSSSERFYEGIRAILIWDCLAQPDNFFQTKARSVGLSSIRLENATTVPISFPIAANLADYTL